VARLASDGSGRSLSPHHAKTLKASAISDDAIAERGYWSATKPGELNGCFSGVQKRAPGLVIPVLNVYGDEAFCQLRPDNPREKDGKRIKYETPAKTRMVLDVPPATRPHLENPKVTLWITEGIKKADSLVSVGLKAIALLGVWSWRGANELGGKVALPDWHEVALNDRKIVLCFDSDALQSPDVHHAVEELGRWLESRKAKPCFVYLPSDGGKIGVDDYLGAGHSKEELVASIEQKWRPLPSSAAKSKPKQAEPVPPEVDGLELLADIGDFVRRFMVLPSNEAADLLALWVLHTWAFEAAFATLYLRVTSAAPDSGKTLLMEILAALCRRGWHAINPSTAVLYRKIDAQTPTLLLDEMDNYPVDDRRDALAVLNGGYKRGATVDRCKDNGELEAFKCFCPKAYAGLDQRSLVSTLLSRSATIRLESKTVNEQTDRWIAPMVEEQTAGLRERCAAWACHNVAALHGTEPELPPWLVNRAAEVWWALLVIADQVGGGWPERARRASEVLTTGGDEHDESSDQVQLLSDIRRAFGDEQTVFTKDLLTVLNADEEGPWTARRRGEGLNARGLSRMLRPFKIRSRTIGSGPGSAKGYQFDQFADVFSRHLPQTPIDATDRSGDWDQTENNVSDDEKLAELRRRFVKGER
jgi:Protein of unknown function (DUF3631)/Domain of unknown function (DUF3854)